MKHQSHTMAIPQCFEPPSMLTGYIFGETPSTYITSRRSKAHLLSLPPVNVAGHMAHSSILTLSPPPRLYFRGGMPPSTKGVAAPSTRFKAFGAKRPLSYRQHGTLPS